MDDMFIHLTNYSINKRNEKFIQSHDGGGDESSSKKSVMWFMEWLLSHGHDSALVWDRIKDVVIKTIASAHSHLVHVYQSSRADGGSIQSCFEILGFDIMLDKKLKPWVIEVNHSPSFQCDSPLDHRIKKGVILEAMKLLRVRADDRTSCLRKERAAAWKRLELGGGAPLSARGEGPKRRLLLDKHEASTMKMFEKIFPLPGSAESYARIFAHDAGLNLLSSVISSSRTDWKRHRMIAKEREEKEKAKEKEEKVKVEEKVKEKERERIMGSNPDVKLMDRSKRRPLSSGRLRKPKSQAALKPATKHGKFSPPRRAISTSHFRSGRDVLHSTLTSRYASHASSRPFIGIPVVSIGADLYRPELLDLIHPMYGRKSYLPAPSVPAGRSLGLGTRTRAGGRLR
eukprot:TRINITY_DN1330_c1_g3_i3.p1 TRINITY_DN1330_c1_g3~~TRINITY_DN1330_c1_g3_i3.p1  ORF type:complete len:400 (+),score=105.60 TRINITY_DN1330_c1_g3_i3:727-1926(+)